MHYLPSPGFSWGYVVTIIYARAPYGLVGEKVTRMKLSLVLDEGVFGLLSVQLRHGKVGFKIPYSSLFDCLRFHNIAFLN